MSHIEELTRICSDQQVYNRIAVASGLMEQVGESILLTPFWKPEFCELVINAAEEHGEFKPHDADTKDYGAAPGQEARVTEFCPELFGAYQNHIREFLEPKLKEFYRCPFVMRRQWDVFRIPFLVKYTMDSQRSMDEHHDSSILSLSIKLSDPKTFKGTDLVFPRQKWSNVDVPQGVAVWFPGQLTHPHYANELTEGKRYGLTGWIRGSNLKDVTP